MTVYVEYTPPVTGAGADIIWTRLWVDTPRECADFAARLGVAWTAGKRSTSVSETQRRRAILMGAIPVHTHPHKPGAHGTWSGVAA